MAANCYLCLSMAKYGRTWPTKKQQTESQCNYCSRSGAVTLATNCYTWPSMTAHGRTWPRVFAYGCVCPHMAARGRIWPQMAAHRCTWPRATAHGHIWLHMAAEEAADGKSVQLLCPQRGRQFDHASPQVTAYGRVWPHMAECGRTWPLKQQQMESQCNYCARNRPTI